MSATLKSIFAFVKNDKVFAIVEAEEKDSAILPFMVDDNSFVVRVSESTGFPYVGCLFSKDLEKFQDFKPYDSWAFNEALFEWHPPVPKPAGNFVWDEANTFWLEIKEN